MDEPIEPIMVVDEELSKWFRCVLTTGPEEPDVAFKCQLNTVILLLTSNVDSVQTCCLVSTTLE